FLSKCPAGVAVNRKKVVPNCRACRGTLVRPVYAGRHFNAITKKAMDFETIIRDVSFHDRYGIHFRNLVSDDAMC
ncbi:hypothetical protein, partial [Escherichia coli]|uniref:hypothetical protein n=1 Tax=Escherichia coli TaxID=562 RepID=UPI0019D6F925